MTLLLLLACEPRPEDLEAADIASIRVEPAQADLTARPGEPAQVDFTAWATLVEDGQEVELDLVSWHSSSTATGEIDTDGVFTSVDTNGGATTITASHLGIEGAAAVSLIFEDYRVEGDLPDSVVEAFAAASPAKGDLPAVLYPRDGARVPRNLEGLTFAWEAPESHDVSRIRLQSEQSDISIYTEGDTWTSDATLWAQVAATNGGGEVTIHIESGSWDGSTLSDVASGPSILLIVNRLDARGSVLYWASLEEAIMRIPFGSTKATVYWKDPQGICVGCHVMNEAEDIMVVTTDGWNGSFAVVDVSDFDSPERVISPNDENHVTFTSIHPDGQLIAGIANTSPGGPSEIRVFSTDDGVKLGAFETEHLATMPVWSPEGDGLMVVHVRGNWLNDAEFERGELAFYPWDGDSFGAPETLAYQNGEENLFAPAFSPDGRWIAYNRSESGDSYANPDAELWLMSRDGLTQVKLDNAMGGNNQHGYPRWAPLPDDDILWLAWSSKREYPPIPTADEQPQIWVTAIDPALAEKGMDPSQPPFWMPGQDASSNNHLPVWWKE